MPRALLPSSILFLLSAPPTAQSATSAAAPGPAPLGSVDVPLERLPDVPTFTSSGGAFLDYDGDGWVDYFVSSNGGLWRNENGGTSFVRVTDLDQYLPPIDFDRYGASAGDYDADGLPDIAQSPRQGCFYLLHNEGGGVFREVATDPSVLTPPIPCGMDGESFAWCDVDADGDLDLWLTAYPPDVSAGSTGNLFLENLGPSGPGGAYRFEERTALSGLGNPPNVNRPEGAQFVDVDRDGDLDGYANGTLYQNVTANDGPRFVPLVRQPTGILLAGVLDEGTVFLDHDLDGDLDLVLVLRGRNVLYENEGDGTFVDASETWLDTPAAGATEGCSAEDWDLDGDLDLTTGNTFRRNMLVETGTPTLRLATTAISATLLNFCLPSWADWDKDGDLDCALANFQGRGAFLRNTLFDADTPALARNSVRIVPLGDSATVARGLESEFGASVELFVRGDTSGRVRRRFVASSHGYLQQSEYALTMALPPGADPEEPARGVVFDVAVDFPSLPQDGIQRIDRHVNPVLGGLALDALPTREIRVFESGIVRIGAAEHAPTGYFGPRLWSSGALRLPVLATPTPEPVATPAPAWIVGLEFETCAGSGALAATELVLDGQLAPAGAARCDANILLWDVTPGEPPALVQRDARATSPRNDRTFLAIDWRLKPGRVYRLLARVTELRASPRAANAPERALQVRGGLSYAGRSACSNPFGEGSLPDPATSYLELRYHERRAAPALR
jgi:hypothetical protein